MRLPTLAQGVNPVRIVHPGGANRGLAPASRRPLRLRRPAADLPRHPPGVLGRRQPVPSPPGPRPPAPGVRPAGHDRGARAALDRHRPARRHRAPGHHHPGARGHRRRAARQPPHRHAPGRRPRGRGAGRLRGAGRRGRPAGRGRGLHRGPDGAGVAGAPVRRVAGPARAPGARGGAVRRVLGGRAGRAAGRARPGTRCSSGSAPTPPGTRWPRRAAGSSCSRRPWPASATPTARATRPGWSPTSGSAARGHAGSRCT